ncbi:MAG: C39 family peptidase [Deltaproteobacteria bacterium]|nr:C39 family peptidase [Deltaproteobacteria bacterium]
MIRIVFIALLILSGCYLPTYYHDRQFSGEGRYINDVPFFPQEDNYCGPATMASVLNYRGYEVSLEEVASKVFTPKLKGSVTVDMLNYAKGIGFYAAWYKGSIQNLRKEIDNRRPLILYLDFGYKLFPAGHPIFPSGHYVVAVGYDDKKEGIIAYSGKDKDLFIPYNKLIKSWGKTGFWTLLILPKD